MSIRHAHYDSIIIGARAAGAATAMLLARAGQRVLVIDRSAAGEDTVSTHALMRPAVVLLQQWGVLPAIVAASTPAIRTTRFVYGRDELAFDVKPADGIDALYAPRRTVLDPALVAAAREAGAEIHHRAKLLRLLWRGDHVRGAVIQIDGDIVWVEADLVIGADGIGSPVARFTRARTTRFAVHATATLYAHVPGSLDGYHWYFAPSLGAGVVPTNDGSCVFAVVPPARYRSELRADPVAGFVRVLDEIAPDAAALVPPGSPPRPFVGRPGYLRQACGPGWALVGDAGAFRDPFTAHGLTDALRDAALLARAVTTHRLADYEEARDDFALPILEVTDHIASFAWDLVELNDLHRRLQREVARELSLVRELAGPPAAGEALLAG